MKTQTFVTMILLVGGVLFIEGCAVNPVTGKRQIMLMSEAQEVQLGRDYDPQVIATFGEYKNEALLALIQQRGKEMGLISHRPNLEYHFKILDSPVINAFAVPGGYVYLTRGILAQFNNEAEMLGVLAHEIGHITARHTASQQSKMQLGQLLFIGGMIASEEFRKYGEYAMAGMQLLFLSFSRENEREADRLGVEYTSKVGYDAKKMADFYKVLIKMNLSNHQGGVPTFMSTHPDPGDRYNAVKQDAQKWQDSLKIASWQVNTDGYLNALEGMVYGEDPRQGYVEGNFFYHPELKFNFSFPSGWKLENSPMQVMIAPEDGKALIVFTLAPYKSLAEAEKMTLEQLKLTPRSSRPITVNGMPAIATISSQTSQDQNTGQQKTIQVLSIFINDNGTFYVFHGVSAEADFNNYIRLFESSMTSFSKLTDPSKLNVFPKRIRVKKVLQTGNFATVLRGFGVAQDKLEEVSFLNNRELTETIPAGTLIKTIGN